MFSTVSTNYSWGNFCWMFFSKWRCLFLEECLFSISWIPIFFIRWELPRNQRLGQIHSWPHNSVISTSRYPETHWNTEKKDPYFLIRHAPCKYSICRPNRWLWSNEHDIQNQHVAWNGRYVLYMVNFEHDCRKWTFYLNNS